MTRPDLPIFYIDCTRPLDEQLTPGQMAWVEQWAESNECRGCGRSHTPDMPCMPAAETERFLREIEEDQS
jgi:hypothetical protein